MEILSATLVENSIKNNTSFRETADCLRNLSEKSFIFLSTESKDGTKASLESSGRSFKEVSPHNIQGMLQEIRLSSLNVDKSWVIFLKEDEVLFENSLVQLKKEISKAEELNCNAIAFRTFFLSGSTEKISIAQDLPSHSTRAFRLNRENHY